MADRLKTGVAWLASKAKSHMAQTVTYKRGANQVVLSATFGSTLLKLDDGAGGFRFVRTDKDVIFTAADLILAAQLTTPQRGDLVTHTEGAVTRTYQVLAPRGEPEWRWGDPHRTMIRAHLKLIDTV